MALILNMSGAVLRPVGGGTPTEPAPLPEPALDVAPLLTAGAGWTGVAGSGYGAAPVDPIREVTKPVLRMLTAPWQSISGEWLLAFDAKALHPTDPMADGISSVEMFCEGASVSQAARRAYSFIKPDGSTGWYFSWAVRLNAADMAARFPGGAIHIYARATALDGAMQQRVIGPYVFYPRAAGAEWPVDYSIGAGGTHSSIGAALTAIRALPVSTPVRVTLLENGDHPLGSGGSSSFPRQAWTRFRCAPGVSARIVRGNLAGGYGSTPWVDGLEYYGPGLTYDTRDVLVSIPNNWVVGTRYNGCYITHEGGRYDWGNHRRPTGFGGGNAPFYIEGGAWVDNLSGGIIRATLICNARLTRFSTDVTQNVACIHNIEVDDVDYGTIRHAASNPLMTVAYSGAGAAAMEVTGDTRTKPRSVALRVNGVAVGSTTILTGDSDSDHTSPQQLADWINSVAGFTAAVQTNLPRAQWIQPPGTNDPVRSFGVVALGPEPVQLNWTFDAHSDVVQLFAGNHDGQVLVHFVRVTNFGGHQTILVEGSYTCPDVSIGWIESTGAAAGQAQVDGNAARTHMLLHKSTFMSQTFTLRTQSLAFPPGGRNVAAGIVARRLSVHDRTDPDLLVTDCHGFDPISTIGGTVNTTRGGAAAEQLPGLDDADLRPLEGGLLMRAGGGYKGSRLPSGQWNY